MIYKYDTLTKNYTMHNTSKTSTTTYLFPSSCDLLNGTIFITGGIPKDQQADPINNSYMIEGYQSRITHAESMITPRYKHELVFCNKCVYAIGGFTKKRVVTKNVEKYDFGVGEWQRVPQMFYERADFTAVGSQRSKSIYVFGGCIEKEDNLVVEKFDCRCEVWVTLKVKMKFEINKYHHLCVVKEGEVVEEKKEKKVKEIKDTPEQKPTNTPTPLQPISATTNPSTSSPLLNPPELLHQKLERKALLLKQGKSPPTDTPPTTREITISKSSTLNPSKTKISSLTEGKKSTTNNNNGQDEIFDIHRKILEEVAKFKFNDIITIIEYVPKDKQVNLHLFSLKDQRYKVIQVVTDEDEEEEMNGEIYRAFFEGEKLYLFRKQPVNRAQVLQIGDMKDFEKIEAKIDAEVVDFERIESEEVPEEIERDKPDYDPVVRNKDVAFLDRVEQESEMSGKGSQEGKRKPLLEETDDTEKKPRKIDFTIKDPQKTSQSQILKKIRSKPFKFEIKSHKSKAIEEKLVSIASKKPNKPSLKKITLKKPKKDSKPASPASEAKIDVPKKVSQKESGKKKVRFE